MANRLDGCCVAILVCHAARAANHSEAGVGSTNFSGATAAAGAPASQLLHPLLHELQPPQAPQPPQSIIGP